MSMTNLPTWSYMRWETALLRLVNGLSLKTIAIVNLGGVFAQGISLILSSSYRLPTDGLRDKGTKIC